VKQTDRLRDEMIERQLKARGITDEATLKAFRKIPREVFVPNIDKPSAYGDYPLPIGSGQTISQPYIVALMTESLSLNKQDKVLEVGTGSGYQAAILADICSKVYGVERFSHFAARALDTLKKLNITNVRIKTGDGTLGWPKHAPYDKIIVTAAAPEIPESLTNQLKEQGIMVIPVGSRWSQNLLKVTKKKAKIKKESICPCVFVPLVGKYGWSNR
jgi:protein-L-isoaspartate(D-aspartate) O-methyltransferase